MERREVIARLAQTKEDEILLARVYDRIRTAQERGIPGFTCFLTQREQMLASELLRGTEFRFFGGPETAEREICCYLPEYVHDTYLTGDESDVRRPIAAACQPHCDQPDRGPGAENKADPGHADDTPARQRGLIRLFHQPRQGRRLPGCR